MINEILDDAKIRMEKSVESLKSELMRLRTGRANTGLLDSIKVDNDEQLVGRARKGDIDDGLGCFRVADV